MSGYYNYISGDLNLDMEDSDFYEDERGISPPDFHYEGFTNLLNSNPLYIWDKHCVLVHRANRIIKYSEHVFLDLLLEDEDGRASWFDGRTASLIDIDESKVVDVRPSNQYYIEDYDLEKLVKHRYKVILEETSEIDDFDQQSFADTILSKQF